MKSKIPNMLTVGRVMVIPLLVMFMYLDGEANRIAAAVIFFVAGFTDLFDGYLARQWNAQSLFGRLLDPIADKVLVVTALIMLVETRILSGVHVIPALIIVGREVLVSAAREVLAQYSKEIEVTWVAKVKTVVQFVAIDHVMTTGTIFDRVHLGELGLVSLWVAAALSVYTLLDYTVVVMRKVSTVQSTHHL